VALSMEHNRRRIRMGFSWAHLLTLDYVRFRRAIFKLQRMTQFNFFSLLFNHLAQTSRETDEMENEEKNVILSPLSRSLTLTKVKIVLPTFRILRDAVRDRWRLPNNLPCSWWFPIFHSIHAGPL
jgi:hypothetical protein